jgi:hypothetical protein
MTNARKFAHNEVKAVLDQQTFSLFEDDVPI